MALTLTSIIALIKGKAKLWGFIALGAIVMSAGIWTYNLYKENQKLKYLSNLKDQNLEATQDSLHQVRAALVESAAHVYKLNDALDKSKHDYLALDARFSSFIDSIDAAGEGISVVTDSTAKVSFQGQQSIAIYSGYTTYTFRDHSSSYYLDIGFQPVATSVQLFQQGDLWKFRIQSLTPGITVMGGGDLDTDTYRRLQKYAPTEPMNRYMVGLALGQRGGPELGYRLDKWNLTAQYDMFDPSPTVIQNLYLHVLWCPF